MAIVVSCKVCGRRYSVKDELAGKKGKCPGCGNLVSAPQPNQTDNFGNAAAGLDEEDAGIRQKTAPSATSPASANQPQPKPKSKYMRLIIAGAVLILIVGLALFAGITTGVGSRSETSSAESESTGTAPDTYEPERDEQRVDRESGGGHGATPEESASMEEGLDVSVPVQAGNGADGENLEAAEAKVYTDWPFDSREARRRQEDTAERLGIPVEKTIDLGDGVTLEMVLIPAGEFIMGSPENEEGRYSNEGPQRRARITRPFYMGRYPVTQAQWSRIMGKTVVHLSEETRPRLLLRGVGPDNPMYYVSWNDALEFIEKAGNNLRLPTEAEWEYACRAGTNTRFYSGDSERDLAAAGWYWGNSDTGDNGRLTHPAGRKRPNAWGLYDMHGNVWEWCSDWWQSHYHDVETTDPTGPRSGSNRVRRGGSWDSFDLLCRSASRSGSAPGKRASDLGFRLAMTIP